MDKLSLSYDLDDLCAVKNRLARDLLAWSVCFTGAAVGVMEQLVSKYENEAQILSENARELRRPNFWNNPPGAEASHWGDD